MKITLEKIAALVKGRLEGDGAAVIEGVNNIDAAGAKEITFADEKHFEEASKCGAAAVILPEGEGKVGKPSIYVADVREAFAVLLKTFTPPLSFEKGVSPEAHIGKDVSIGKDV
ncbi:MAG: UDP-3-O-(3-hydroxymyristoyl)glucosamine N-acyltransferase, partial [Schwartzia sp.]|nr:UDP-3-O-(3-hydroxymyristoyl)glucosamine N-acyltransferase [Schwartzia sp. (in: firmicutes)]